MATQKCSQCLAPLPLEPPGTVVACTFCKTENRMHGHAPGMHAYAQPKSGPQGIIALVSVAFAVLVGGAVAASYALSAPAPQPTPITFTAPPTFSGRIVTTTTSTSSTTSTGIPTPAGPRGFAPLRVADLGAWQGGPGWTPVETTGIVGELARFDPIANVAWAEDLAKHWSPDAALYAVYLTGVRDDGTLDATSTAVRTEADYRFYSPIRRRAAREMQAVSNAFPPTEFRIRVTEGSAVLMLRAQTDEDEPIAPGALTCPLARVLEDAKKEGLPQRPGYALMARVNRGAWRWSVNMTDVPSRVGWLRGACATR